VVSTKEASSDVPVVAAGAGFVLTALLVFAVLFFMATSTYETWGGVLVGAALVAVTIPVLRKQAEREEAPGLFWLLVAALLLKLVGAAVRQYVAFDIYEGAADAGRYHDFGVEFHQQFRSGNLETGRPLSSTHFIEFLTALVYAVTGPTRLGGFLVYSWFGFLGLLFFYRAFYLAVPWGKARLYARLLFFLPSLWYWPSSIGKEAWMCMTLGLAALGAAHALKGRSVKGFSYAAMGLWLAALVRPHFAGIMALAMVAGFLFRPSRKELGAVGPVVKGVVLAAVTFAALFFVKEADRFLREQGIESDKGVTTTLTQTSDRTLRGGSAFAPSILDSPQRAPVAAFTVLFRPLIVEAHNSQALIAALEATFLLLISLFRWRSIMAGLLSIRRQPYLAFAFAYTGLMILALSSIANFGILARQRIQLLPILLVLLCVDAAAVRRKSANGHRESANGHRETENVTAS
jgi:hypothetical protein